MAPIRNRMIIVYDITLKSQKVSLWLYIAEKHLKKEVGRAYCQSESLECNHWSIFLFILTEKGWKKGKGRTNDQNCRHIRTDIVVWKQQETWRRLACFHHSISIAGQQLWGEKSTIFSSKYPPWNVRNYQHQRKRKQWLISWFCSCPLASFPQQNKPFRSHSPWGPCIKITQLYSQSLFVPPRHLCSGISMHLRGDHFLILIPAGE